jgi:hypothetical protein
MKIFLTTVFFAATMTFIACKKLQPAMQNVVSAEQKKTKKPGLPGLGVWWKEWGHIKKHYNPINGEYMYSDCPGAGLCKFKIKKIKLPYGKFAPLQQDATGTYFIAEVDEDFPMNEISNFLISETMTEYDEDGNTYTIQQGNYPYNATINGFKVPVTLN